MCGRKDCSGKNVLTQGGKFIKSSAENSAWNHFEERDLNKKNFKRATLKKGVII